MTAEPELGGAPAPADRRLLARNTVYNLAGQITPLIAALFAMPGLLGALGAERVGVLALAWAVVGYFSLFDFGIGRALTKLVAERLGTNGETQIAPLISSALIVLVVVSAITAIGVAAAADFLVSTVLKVPVALHAETVVTLYVLAATIPFVITTGALRGVLEAQHRFGILNAIRIPLGIVTFMGPWAVAQYTDWLPAAVIVLAVARVIAWLAHTYFCASLLPQLTAIRASFACVRMLLGLGGWMTVSNVVGPLMVYLDRFVVGALLSMAAVAYYATPYEVITKLWLVPAAIAGVLFPAFAVHSKVVSDEAARLFVTGLKWVFFFVFPPTLLAVIFAVEGLQAWLGLDFAQQSAPVLRILAIAVLANCVAQIPFAFVQAAGRPDLTAKLHLLELPLYLAALWWLIVQFGITGAAIAWLGRALLDLIGLLFISHWWLPRYALLKRVVIVAAPTLALFIVALVLRSTSVKIGYALIVLTAFPLLIWRFALGAGEKQALRDPLSIFTQPDPRPRS